MAKRKMLTKPVAAQLHKDMNEALAAGTFALNEGQTIDDVIEHVRQGIKTDEYQPGVTFAELLKHWSGAEASSGDDATAKFNQAAAEAIESGELHLGSMTPERLQQYYDENPDARDRDREAGWPWGAPAGEDTEPIDDLASWVDLMAKAKAKVKQAQEMADMAKAKITERLGDKTQGTVGGKVVATYNWIDSTYFDKKKLAAEHPDLVEKYTRPNPSRRFELK